MRDLLSKSIASKPLAKNASTIDKIKHRLCKEFVVYKSLHQISQKDLAAKIGIDEALMSKTGVTPIETTTAQESYTLKYNKCIIVKHLNTLKCLELIN